MLVTDTPIQSQNHKLIGCFSTVFTFYIIHRHFISLGHCALFRSSGNVTDVYVPSTSDNIFWKQKSL